MTDLLDAVKAIRANADAYMRAEDFYFGEVPEVFCSEAIRRTLRDQVNGFDVSLAGRVVDAVLDRVRILAISVPGDETATRRLVDEVWLPNRMDRQAKTVHWSALTHGDAYVIVWPGDEDGSVELHYNDPAGCRVFYDPENPQVKRYAAKLWAEGSGDDRRHRLNLYYPDRVERYVTKSGANGGEAEDWAAFEVDGEAWPIPNPYGAVPVFHWRAGEQAGGSYGRPVHQGAFKPQNALTKLSATLMSTVDFQAFPQRWALTKAGQMPTVEAVFDDDEDPETSSTGSVQGGPGRILELTADQVGQFDPAQMDAFLQPIGFYVRAMAASTATPMRFFDPQAQVPSGEALRADEAPLAQRIADFEELAGETWQEALVFAARVAGFEIPAPDVTWGPVQTVNDREGWDTVKAKQEAGVPARQALTEAGYTSDLVEGWLADSAAPNLDARLAALDKLGTALQKLGAAAQLGAIDQATVGLVVDQLLGDLARDQAA